MKQRSKLFKIAYSAVVSLALLAALSSATYAWFSSNSIVNTDYVTSHTATDEVELLVSTHGGGGFDGKKEAAIGQVNKTSTTQLMPVSTADLKNFVTSAGTVDNQAIHFYKVENERYYYHGRIYLMAKADSSVEGRKLDLYLDGSEDNGGSFFKNAKGYILNAARLGLTFDGSKPIIFRVTDEENPRDDRVSNTVLNGVPLNGKQVIDSSGTQMKAVTDPSVLLKDYLVGAGGRNTDKPLLTMELNRIYEVDIFFYVEGCDPDCSDVAQKSEVNFHLSFYGILAEEG